MASSDITCVICGVERVDEKLVPFTTRSLQTCNEVLQIRKDNGLKFKDVILPSSVSLTDGYHVKCYSNFTALMRMYLNKEISITEKQSPTRTTCVICDKSEGEGWILLTKKCTENFNELIKIYEDNDLKFNDIVLPSRVSENDKCHKLCYKNFTTLISNHLTTLELPTLVENPHYQHHQAMIKMEPSADDPSENAEEIVKPSEITCVFCNERDDERKVLFTEKSLQKCQRVLEIRKDNNLKFKDVILPSSVGTNDGYHTRCYCNFTALMRIYRNKEEFVPVNRSRSESSSADDHPAKNQHETMMLTATCSICCEISSERLTLFTAKILKKCQEVLEIRRAKQLKYKDVILPSSPNMIDGYHTKCYANFIALMYAYRAKAKVMTDSQFTPVRASNTVHNLQKGPHQLQVKIEPTSPLADYSANYLEGSPIVCIICREDKDDRATLLSARTLNTCREVLQIRKEKNLKYKDVILPSRVNKTDGYHAKCYANFVALIYAHRAKMKSIADEQSTTWGASNSVENTDDEHHQVLIKIEPTSPATEDPEESLQDSMSFSIFCVFCGEHRDESLILFTEKTLQKSQEALIIRKSCGLKFNDIILPSTVNETDGYHSWCYGNFTALKRSYHDTANSITDEQSTTLAALSSVESILDEDHEDLMKIERPSRSFQYPVENADESVASSSIMCVVCGEHTHERTLLFTERSLKKCKEVLQIRKENKLKYKDIILPAKINGTDGYHAKCYACFIALGYSYRVQIRAATLEASTSELEVEDDQDEHPSVLMKNEPITPSINHRANSSTIVCAFCGKRKNGKTILFTIKSLQKSHEALKIRKNNGLKFGDLILPSTVSQTTGYHSKCYGKFTALKRSYFSLSEPQSPSADQPEADYSGENLPESHLPSKILCVICGEYRKDRCILFTERSLQKCYSVLQIRKSNGLKYRNVILPSADDGTSGYHHKCYANFTSLSNLYSGKFKSITKPSSIPSPSAFGENTHDKVHEAAIKVEPPSYDLLTDDQPEDLEEDRMSSDIECVICCEWRDEKTILFTEQTLEKCKEILKIRKDKEFKSTNVILPSCVNTTDGYHSKCYKNFTALPRTYQKIESIYDQYMTPEASTSVKTSCDEYHQVSDDEEDSEKFTIFCFFCGKDQKKSRGSVESLCTTDKHSLKAIIEGYSIAVDDPDILERFETSVSPKISYHRSCKNSYHNKAKQPVEPPQIDCYVNKKLHSAAYSEVFEYIYENVIKKKQCYFLSSLCFYYFDALQRIEGKHIEDYDDVSTTTQLEAKILTNFGGRIKVVTVQQRKVIISHRYGEFDDAAFSRLEKAEILQKAALIVRNRALELANQGSSGGTSNNSPGEFFIPGDLHDFYMSLVGGTDGNIRKSYDCKKIAESLAQDVIHAVSGRRIKTTKNVALGVSSKSTGNNRRFADAGDEGENSSSDDVIEEIETGPEFMSVAHTNVCLPGDLPSPNPFGGVEINVSNGFLDMETCDESSNDTADVIEQDGDGTSDPETNGVVGKHLATNGGKRQWNDDEQADGVDRNFSKMIKTNPVYF